MSSSRARLGPSRRGLAAVMALVVCLAGCQVECEERADVALAQEWTDTGLEHRIRAGRFADMDVGTVLAPTDREVVIHVTSKADQLLRWSWRDACPVLRSDSCPRIEWNGIEEAWGEPGRERLLPGSADGQAVLHLPLERWVDLPLREGHAIGVTLAIRRGEEVETVPFRLRIERVRSEHRLRLLLGH